MNIVRGMQAIPRTFLLFKDFFYVWSLYYRFAHHEQYLYDLRLVWASEVAAVGGEQQLAADSRNRVFMDDSLL